MRTLFVHPSALLYSEIFLRLEPLGLERVAAAARDAGHEVRVVDLQIFSHEELRRELAEFRPEAVGFGLNYLANVPEVIDLAHRVKALLPGAFVFVGGHSMSFLAGHVLEQADGAVDAVVRGEGETAVGPLLDACRDGGAAQVPGVHALDGIGPAPVMMDDIDNPATRPRPDASAQQVLHRGARPLPRRSSSPAAARGTARSARRGPSTAAATARCRRKPRRRRSPPFGSRTVHRRRRRVHPCPSTETRSPPNSRSARSARSTTSRPAPTCCSGNPEVFERWKRLGLNYMFLGMEALDEEGLDLFRKRVNPDQNFEALEVARKIGMTVAINLIVDPQWDRQQFQRVREWALSVPEIVHLTVMTPYPGTEIWHTESRKLTTRDYRLFDIQHAVLPTKLPLPVFYEELVKTQSVINRKHLGVAAVAQTLGIIGKHLVHGQTNFARMLWKFPRVYNAERQLADHDMEVRYELPVPEHHAVGPRDRRELYIHPQRSRA